METWFLAKSLCLYGIHTVPDIHTVLCNFKYCFRTLKVSSDGFVIFRACPTHGSTEQVQSGAERSVHQYGQLQSCVNFEEVRFICDDVYT